MSDSISHPMGRPATGIEFGARGIIVLFVVLFLLRLGLASLIDATVDVYKEVDVFSIIARNIMDGYGFVATPGEPNYWRSPAYPYFLAAIWSVFGETQGFGTVLVTHAALDAITGLLIYSIGCRLFGPAVGFVAALLFILYPLGAYYTLRTMSEPLFAFTLTAFTAALICARSGDKLSHFFLAGLIAGVAALVKPVAFLLTLFLAGLMVIVFRRKFGKMLVQVAVMVLGMALVVSPWTARNYLTSGHFFIITSGAGYTLWSGNHLINDGLEEEELRGEQWKRYVEDRAAILAPYVGKDYTPPPEGVIEVRGVNMTPELDKVFLRKALEEMREHPLDTLALMVRKFGRLWFRISLFENRWAQTYVYIAQSILLAFAVYGTVQGLRSRRPLFPLLATLLFFALIHSIIYATLRYSVTLMPLVSLLAANGVIHAAALVSRHTSFKMPKFLLSARSDGKSGNSNVLDDRRGGTRLD